MEQDVLEQLLEYVRSHYFGKYRGTVVSNDDPTSRGRLQVTVPNLVENTWAMPCVPYAGSGVGFFAIPPVGANVWVEFEGGDPDYPIWSGCFWGITRMSRPIRKRRRRPRSAFPGA